MEPLAHGAIRFRHLGDLREHGAFHVALSARAPRRGVAFSSLWRSFIAARSSSVHPSDVLSIAVLLANFFVSFIAGFLSAGSDGDDPDSREPPRRGLLENCSGYLGETSDGIELVATT